MTPEKTCESKRKGAMQPAGPRVHFEVAPFEQQLAEKELREETSLRFCNRFRSCLHKPPVNARLLVLLTVQNLGANSYFSNAIGNRNGSILQFSRAPIRLEESSDPLAHAGCKLWELGTGISNDLRDEIPGLVRDGYQYIQFLLYNPTNIALQREKGR